jgi:hypothetical protein
MNKIKQKMISKEADISGPFVSQIINGHRRPSWRTAKKLAMVTSTKPELWLDGSPDEIKNALLRMSIGVADESSAANN